MVSPALAEHRAQIGNVEDFVTRWGARYDYMIVLDADSLIDAPTLNRWRR